MFVEPPKDFWFVMGEYLPPPYGLLQLAGYLETKMPEAEIEVLDCQAMSLDWKTLGKRLESFNPDVVAASGFATCNVYIAARTLETAKKLKPEVLTIAGGLRKCYSGKKSILDTDCVYCFNHVTICHLALGCLRLLQCLPTLRRLCC